MRLWIFDVDVGCIAFLLYWCILSIVTVGGVGYAGKLMEMRMMGRAMSDLGWVGIELGFRNIVFLFGIFLVMSVLSRDGWCWVGVFLLFWKPLFSWGLLWFLD